MNKNSSKHSFLNEKIAETVKKLSNERSEKNLRGGGGGNFNSVRGYREIQKNNDGKVVNNIKNNHRGSKSQNAVK